MKTPPCGRRRGGECCAVLGIIGWFVAMCGLAVLLVLLLALPVALACAVVRCYSVRVRRFIAVVLLLMLAACFLGVLVFTPATPEWLLSMFRQR